MQTKRNEADDDDDVDDEDDDDDAILTAYDHHSWLQLLARGPFPVSIATPKSIWFSMI